MPRHIHFVTGRLAERSLRRVVAELADSIGFEYSIDVMPISVAALLTPKWIAPRLSIPPDATEILLPGYCDRDLAPIQRVSNLPVHVGPKELRALPDYFGGEAHQDYGAHDIEILAEINHAPRLSQEQILSQAERYRASGADVIDIGCEPDQTWPGLSDCVRALVDRGFRVSVDSMNSHEIAAATRAGAELVLSVNSNNRESAADWGCEVVAIPDHPRSLAELDQTVDWLSKRDVSFRLDPILEPIGCGFAVSLGRYLELRRRYPEAEMMMGIGNLTELSDVDSSGINLLLLGFCQELAIRSVLTTEVINWARSSVAECDIARRLAHFAVVQGVPPKHLDDRLVMLRDVRLYPQGAESLTELGGALKDNNYRVFAEGGELHLLSAGIHLRSTDPFDVFQRLMSAQPKNLTTEHAFYLGYELAKAVTALTLGKQYIQDQALDWGFLTEPKTGRRSNG